MQTTVWLGSLGGRCHVCTGAGETPDIRVYRLHGGWDTIIAAILFWLSAFIVLILVVSWLRRRRKRRHSGS